MSPKDTLLENGSDAQGKAFLAAWDAHRTSLAGPNVRHERRRKGREAAFRTPARWRG